MSTHGPLAEVDVLQIQQGAPGKGVLGQGATAGRDSRTAKITLLYQEDQARSLQGGSRESLPPMGAGPHFAGDQALDGVQHQQAQLAVEGVAPQHRVKKWPKLPSLSSNPSQ